ncbi:MAG: helix-turn-helix transcriptional regulator [Pseudomonadota bacterium]
MSDTPKSDRLIIENLRALSDEKGLSLTTWAIQAGLSRTGVTDILSGRSRSPGLETLEKLAAAAGVPLSRIIFGPAHQDETREQRELVELVARLPEKMRPRIKSLLEDMLEGVPEAHQESNGET